MNDVKARRKVGSSRNGRVLGELRFERGMEAVVGEEGSLTSGGISEVVECELGKREVVDPIVLVIRDVGAKVRFKCLVGAFGKSVGLRMKCG